MFFTEEQNLALKRFAELEAKLGSQSKACQQIGISAAIISQLRKGTYKGDVEAQFAKLNSYFELKAEAAAQPSGATTMGYAPTSISTKVYEDIRNCQLQGGLAISCGAAGIGKTMASKRYVRDHPSDSIYIAVNPCLVTVRSLLRVLCDKLNVSEKRVDEMWFGIAGKLRDGMVIIIDEAQHCPIKTLEALRAFSDYFAEQGQTLGIALVGNTETVNNMGGKKKAEFAQISSRTRRKKVYDTTCIKRDDIRLLFPDLAGKEPEIDFLYGVACSTQAIRGTVNLYYNALDNANTSYEGLVAMAKHMGLKV